MTDKDKKPRGRPSAYKEEYCKQAYKLCLLGAKDTQLADFFNVSEQTLNAWKNQYPDFLEALKDGKDRADAEVAKSLYHRARGYSHPEDKIFNNNGEELVVRTTKYYPPDTTACIFWLKNRQKEAWRDQLNHDHKHNGTVAHEHRGLSRPREILGELFGPGDSPDPEATLPN